MPYSAMKTITMQKLTPSQDHHKKLAPSQDHQTPMSTTADVCNIVSLKKTFPASFDTIENMPGAYSISLAPSIPPVQHACRKVPIEYHEQIEKTLQKKVDLQVITPVTEPVEWVCSLTYPQKPYSTLLHLLRPSRPKESHHPGTLQNPYPGGNLPQAQWHYSDLQTRCERWLLEHPSGHTLITSHNIQDKQSLPSHAI